MPQLEPSNNDTWVSAALAGRDFAIERKTMVHRDDLDLVGREVLDRMVGAVMTLLHLKRARADRQPEHLVAETDAEDRNPRGEQALDRRHRIAAGLGGIARPIGKEHAVGLQREHVLGGGGRRHHRDRAAAIGEQAQNVALDAVVDRDDPEFGRARRP